MPGAPNTARGGYYDLGQGLKGDPVPESFGDTPSLDESLASISTALDNAFGTTRGGILYRGAATWLLLPPSTSGFSLETLGAGADPAWASISTLLDKLGNTQGMVLYRSAAGWTVLAAGASGQFLKTLGAGANPAWATVIAGDVLGPGAAVDLDFVQFDGTTGKLIKDGGLSRDTDGTMAANSDSRIPSQKAVVTYVAAHGTGLANPSATASDVAVNGAAATAMRSDAAPAVQLGSNAQFGLAKGDGSSVTIVGGVASVLPAGVTSAADTDLDLMLFGTGIDGDLVIAAGTTSLTQDKFYHNLTISGTGKLNLNGWRAYVSGTLDLTNAPAGAIVSINNLGSSLNGNNSATTGGAVGGATISVIETIGKGQSGGTGANGATGAGTQAANVGSIGNQIPVTPGAGGKGGTVGANAGGISRAGVTGALTIDVRKLTDQLYGILNGVVTYVNNGIGAPGGSGGAGDGVGTGGGGGGGGATPGVVWIAARTIARATATTAARAINADAGTGGNGGTGTGGTNTGGGGGGGGAAGGWVMVIYRFLTGTAATNMVSASGANGGTGGTGRGTGIGGDGGAAGSRGRIDLYNIATGTWTHSETDTTTVAGSPGVGTVGGAGGVANTQFQSL